MEQFDDKAVASAENRRAQVKASTFVQESKSRQRNAWGGGSTVRIPQDFNISGMHLTCLSFSALRSALLAALPHAFRYVFPAIGFWFVISHTPFEQYRVDHRPCFELFISHLFSTFVPSSATNAGLRRRAEGEGHGADELCGRRH